MPFPAYAASIPLGCKDVGVTSLAFQIFDDFATDMKNLFRRKKKTTPPTPGGTTPPAAPPDKDGVEKKDDAEKSENKSGV